MPQPAIDFATYQVKGHLVLQAPYEVRARLIGRSGHNTRDSLWFPLVPSRNARIRYSLPFCGNRIGNELFFVIFVLFFVV